MKSAERERPTFRVLFLCTGNSCRSQMAEGWAKHLLGDRIEAHSAGTQPSTVNPYAIRVMNEVGVDISAHRSKSLDEFLKQSFDLILTLCDDVRGQCPVFPGRANRVHTGFPDPAVAKGPEEEILEAFRDVRDQIRHRLIPLLEEELAKRAPHSE